MAQSVRASPRPFSRKYTDDIQKLFFQTDWTNFNQTWYNTLLGEGDSSLFNWIQGPHSFSRGDKSQVLTDLLAYNCSFAKPFLMFGIVSYESDVANGPIVHLLENHWTNCNQTCHTTCVKDKWRVTSFPKIDNDDTVKLYWRLFLIKIFFSSNPGNYQPKLPQSTLELLNGIKICSNAGASFNFSKRR